MDGWRVQRQYYKKDQVLLLIEYIFFPWMKHTVAGWLLGKQCLRENLVYRMFSKEALITASCDGRERTRNWLREKTSREAG